MFRKSPFVILGAVVALSLSIPSANAFPKGGGIGQGPNGNPGIVKPMPKPIIKPILVPKPVVNKPNPIFVPHWPNKPPVIVTIERPPVVTVVPSVTRVVSQPAAGPCTCLSKQYTPEGAVVFSDRCTNEMAMNPPEPTPQHSGIVDPTQQTAQSTLPVAQ